MKHRIVARFIVCVAPLLRSVDSFCCETEVPTQLVFARARKCCECLSGVASTAVHRCTSCASSLVSSSACLFRFAESSCSCCVFTERHLRLLRPPGVSPKQRNPGIMIVLPHQCPRPPKTARCCVVWGHVFRPVCLPGYMQFRREPTCVPSERRPDAEFDSPRTELLPVAAAVLMPAKATRLAIEPHNGLAPPRWQGGGHNHLGTVVAARTDHQDFTGQDWAVRVGARIDVCAACVLYFYLLAWVDSALVLSAVGLVWGFAKLRSSWYSGISFLPSPPHRVLRIRQNCASSPMCCVCCCLDVRC